MHKQGKLFIVSAPSGAGKTTLVTAALECIGSEYGLERVITYTTRLPRPTDIPGKDYHFVTLAEFQKKIAEGFFLEWSVAYGTYYGSPASIIRDLNKGKSYIMITDRCGARTILTRYPAAVLIWIYTKDIATLESRLVGRSTETVQQVQQRLLLAQQELQEELQEQLFKYHILNESFQEALQELLSTILLSLK